MPSHVASAAVGCTVPGASSVTSSMRYTTGTKTSCAVTILTASALAVVVLSGPSVPPGLSGATNLTTEKSGTWLAGPSIDVKRVPPMAIPAITRIGSGPVSTSPRVVTDGAD